MTVEHLIDNYLTAVRQIVGTGPTPTRTATVALPPALDLPTAWAGPASHAAITASQQLQQSRQRLTSASTGVATLTRSAAHIAQQASTHLDVINGEWDQAKAATTAITPESLRDAALIPAAQTTINEAVTLITDTATKYADAAAAVRTHAADLPLDSPASAAPAAADELTAGEAFADQAAPLSDPDVSILATGLPTTGDQADPAASLAAMAGMAPDMMAPAMELPGTLLPMAASLPANAMVPLGGMLSPLFKASDWPTAPTSSNETSGTTAGSHIGKPGTVTAAIEQALDVLGITDPDARQHWRDGYQTLIRRESTFDAHAINNSDSNAVGPILADGGHAGSSRGLAQMVPGTFRAYHVPGTSDDIFDPVANIAASMNYAMHHYHVSRGGVDLAAKIPQANPYSTGGGY